MNQISIKDNNYMYTTRRKGMFHDKKISFLSYKTKKGFLIYMVHSLSKHKVSMIEECNHNQMKVVYMINPL